MAVKPVGMATRSGAEKSFQPHTTKEMAAEKSRNMPRKSIACKVRSDSRVRHNRSPNGTEGAAETEGPGAGAVGEVAGEAAGRGAGERPAWGAGVLALG